MSMHKHEREKDYSDGRTKQSFQDSADINKILAKAAQGDAISHLAKHGAVYGDFTDVEDLLTAYARLEKGQEIFNELPGEVRREFGNDLAKFYGFVNNPENRDRLAEVLPGLAKPGNQLPAFTIARPKEEPDPTTPVVVTPVVTPTAETTTTTEE